MSRELPEGEAPPDKPYPERPGYLGKFLEIAVDDLRTRMELRRVCESPIEVMLAGSISSLLKRLKGHELELLTQYPLGRFRYDIAIRKKGTDKPLLLIECDGKQFHQTQTQLANDRRKDKAAADAGIKLLRCTGSEINRYEESLAWLALRECGVNP